MGWYLPKTAPRESPFFCNTHPDFVRELASSAVDRIFMPGDCVVNEGHRPWTREDGWFGSNSKFPGGKLPWAWYNLEGGWNDEKECWCWFEIQNLKVNPETPPKQHWLSKHPSNHKDVFHFLGCVWHFGWRPLDSHDFLSMLFRGVCLTSGEVGNSMFILLNGSADVFVPDLRWRIGHRKHEPCSGNFTWKEVVLHGNNNDQIPFARY